MSTQRLPEHPPSPALATRLAALLLLAATLPPGRAAATEREHRVKDGQSMASIARSYGVTVWSLAAVNDLKPDELVRAGRVLAIPDRGAVYVNEGQTLWSVARRHHVTVDELARCNGLTPTASLRPGMRLTLPGAPAGGAKREGRASAEPRGWGVPKHKGRLQLLRVATNASLSITIADAKGRIRPGVGEKLARFLKPRDSRRTKVPPRRLLSILAQASDHFGGRKLHVVSGYRLAKGFTGHESRHVQGAAVDFRVEGVPNRVLRDYLRHFDDVGVGYYPNSTFVHLDVRDRNAYWIDLSGAGERPRYLARAARDVFNDADAKVTETPIAEIVEAALEEMQHEEPDDGEESEDE